MKVSFKLRNIKDSELKKKLSRVVCDGFILLYVDRSEKHRLGIGRIVYNMRDIDCIISFEKFLEFLVEVGIFKVAEIPIAQGVFNKHDGVV